MKLNTKQKRSIAYNGHRYISGFYFNIYNKNNTKMKDNKHIQRFNEHQENLNISDVSSSFTSWDMYNAFYAGRAVSANTDEDTRFQDLVMKYETFDKFLKEYQNSKK